MFAENNYLFNFMVWDIPGHLKNSDYAFRYCLGSTFIFYVFDLNDRKSFVDLKDWLRETEICDNGELMSDKVPYRQQARS